MAGPHAGNRNRPAYSGQSRFRFPKQIIELFAPRPPLEFKPPVKRRKLPPMTGIARYVSKFGSLPPVPASSIEKKKKEEENDNSANITTTAKIENEKPGETEAHKSPAEKADKSSGGQTNMDMDDVEKESDGVVKKEPQEQGDDGGEMNMDMEVEDENESTGKEGGDMDVEEKPAAGNSNSKSDKSAEANPKTENKPAGDAVPFETPARRRLRKHQKKIATANKLVSEGLSKWDPFANSDEKTRDPRRTLFVAGFERNLPEARLRCEFEVYGRISKVKIPISKKKNGIPCKYGFIEFEKESGMKAALDGCRGRGKRIDGKRITVDMERGRTIEGWTPNRLKHPEKRRSPESAPRPEPRTSSRPRY